MSEKQIRLIIVIVGFVLSMVTGAVGVAAGIVSTSLVLISRVETRVAKEVTVRVKQAVLEKELEAQEKRWWLQQGDIDGLENEIDGIRVDMARSHSNQ